MVVVILVFTIAMPIAWFISESHAPRWLRLILGMLAILLSIGVAFVVGSLERFNSNAWFGAATKELIDATVAELDAGRNENVVRALKELQEKYRPTYENRARYPELVQDAIERMKQAPAAPPVP